MCVCVCSVMSESLWLYGLQGARELASQAPPSIEFSRQDILECVALFSSRASSQPRDRTHISRIAGRFFTTAASGKTHLTLITPLKILTPVQSHGGRCYGFTIIIWKGLNAVAYQRKSILFFILQKIGHRFVIHMWYTKIKPFLIVERLRIQSES